MQQHGFHGFRENVMITWEQKDSEKHLARKKEPSRLSQDKIENIKSKSYGFLHCLIIR